MRSRKICSRPCTCRISSSFSLSWRLKPLKVFAGDEEPAALAAAAGPAAELVASSLATKPTNPCGSSAWWPALHSTCVVQPMAAELKPHGHNFCSYSDTSKALRSHTMQFLPRCPEVRIGKYVTLLVTPIHKTYLSPLDLARKQAPLLLQPYWCHDCNLCRSCTLRACQQVVPVP